MIARILALLALAATFTTAHAQSFSCSQASTPRERAICANPNLQKLDSELAAQYKRVHEGVPRDAAPTVLAGQRAWLHSLDTGCAAVQQQQLKLSSCLTDRYNARLAELAGDQPLSDGHWLLTSGNGATAHPVILTPTPAEAAWNRAVVQQIASHAHAAAKDLAQCRHEASGQGADTAANMEAVTDWRIAAANDQLISTRFSVYEYCGGAHGSDDFTFWNWSLAQGRELTVADIFRDGTAWQQRALDATLEQLRKNSSPGDGDYLWKGDELTQGVTAALKTTKQWSPARDGLHIQFTQYQVAAYAFGEPTVVIPWQNLAPFLALGWKPDLLPPSIPDPTTGN